MLYLEVSEFIRLETKDMLSAWGEFSQACIASLDRDKEMWVGIMQSGSKYSNQQVNI